MLRDAFYLARTDARYLLTRRETIVWTFVMPLVFFYFIGAITGGNIRTGPEADPLAIRGAVDAGPLADPLIQRLEAAHFRAVRTQSDAEFYRYSRRLEIPGGFSASVAAGTPVQLHFSRTGQDQDAQYDQMRVERVLASLQADLALAGPNFTPERLSALAAEPRMVTLEVRAAGKRQGIPTGMEQSVPGTMVMFTLLVLFTSGAVHITIERRTGILRRLASSPMSRGAVVVGKWGARMIVGAIQIAFAMLAGKLIFHVNWGANLPVVALVLLAYGALAAALAMLLGTVIRTEGQVIALGVILSNVMAGLGGCWWPIEVTPLWAQKMALFLPTGLTMNALHKLVNFGAAPAAVAPHFIALTAAAAISLYVLSRVFRFE